MKSIKTKKSQAKTPKLEAKKEGKEGGAISDRSRNGESGSVDVPNPNEPSGFKRGLTAEEILGATEMDGQILFLIKW